MNIYTKVLLLFIALSGLSIGSPKKIGIYLGDEKIIDLKKVKFVDKKSASVFLNEIRTASEGKLDFNWDKRGAYILIFEGELVKGYECRPWMSGGALCLLPTQFKYLSKSTLKFSGYKINKGFKVPKLDRKLLFSLFSDLKKLEKQSKSQEKATKE